MRIEIILPREHRKAPPFTRAKYGQLVVLDGDKKLLGPLPCKGKGGGDNLADSRDWRKVNGDTPTGEYLAIVQHWGDVEKYGPNEVLRLLPSKGNAVEATKLGRDGFAIHGGRNQQILTSTHGCVRVFDRDMRKIIDLIKSRGLTQIPIKITEK